MNWKKLVLVGCALLLTLGANLNVGWCISLEGDALDGNWSSECIRRATMAARLAAEEILPGKAVLPQVERRLSLSFRKPAEDVSELSHALLCRTPGVSLSDFVLVNGVTLGCVADGDILLDELRSFVANQMPNAASYGSYSGDISIDPRYTRSGKETPFSDMVLLVSGMAPVFYVDAEGRMA